MIRNSEIVLSGLFCLAKKPHSKIMLKVIFIVAAAMIVGSNGDGASKVICAYDSSSFIREGKFFVSVLRVTRFFGEEKLRNVGR